VSSPSREKSCTSDALKKKIETIAHVNVYSVKPYNFFRDILYRKRQPPKKTFAHKIMMPIIYLFILAVKSLYKRLLVSLSFELQPFTVVTSGRGGGGGAGPLGKNFLFYSLFCVFF